MSSNDTSATAPATSSSPNADASELRKRIDKATALLPHGKPSSSQTAAEEEAATATVKEGESSSPSTSNGYVIRRYQVGAYTVEEVVPPPLISRLADLGKPDKWIKHCVSRARENAKLLPYAARLLGETLTLAPGHTAVVLGGNFVRGLLPSYSLQATGEMIKIASDAAERKVLDKPRLMRAAATSMGVVILGQLLGRVIDQADGILDRRLGSKLEYELMKVNLRLDLPSFADQEVQEQVRSASHISAFRPFHVLSNFVRTVAETIDLFSQLAVIRGLLDKKTRLLFFVCIARPIMEFLSMSSAPNFRLAMTDPTALRMREMFRLATSNGLRREVLLLGLRQSILSEYAEANKKLKDTSLRPPSGEQLRTVGSSRQLIGSALDAMVYIVFALRASTSKSLSSLATLTLVQQTSRQMVHRFQVVRDQASGVVGSFADIQGLYDAMTLQPQIASPPTRVALRYEHVATLSDGSLGAMKIEFRNVTFSYPEAKQPALKNCSFVIPAGSTCSLVGANGSGKSTVILLLGRLYDPQEGTIFINDHDIKLFDLEALRRVMSILPQDYVDFPLSVAENVGVGSTHVSQGHKLSSVPREDIVSSLDAAGANSFVTKLSHGVDTPMSRSTQSTAGMAHFAKLSPETISETRSVKYDPSPRSRNSRGLLMRVRNPVQTNVFSLTPIPAAQFSGGQRQRIGVARAYMRRGAKLHCLDEPSASLDPKAEASLFDTLAALGKGEDGNRTATTLFSTHRFSTMKHATLILVMEGGSVVEAGSHEELMSIESGKYRELYDLQAQGFLRSAETAKKGEMEPLPPHVPAPPPRPPTPEAAKKAVEADEAGAKLAEEK